jgi:hypothetical protein
MTGLNGSSVRLLNATSSGERLTFEAPEDDFRRFDRFPAALRWRISNNNTKLAAAAFEEHLAWAQRQGLGVSRTIAKINEIERNEIAVFAGEYRARYGTPLPHIAAGASIQRYGALGPSRHPPRRVGAPVLRAHAKRRRFRVRVPPVIEMAA